ncbi:Reverse transcriptase-RNase H-integrase [Mycena venus]|uniref:Reverse transcriptase-RNase H-integrase n=1 Tax=Mycena venus TaxID=2733690 RepID=A0A8H6XQM2_9AGAR|nr:Reverse transcriptase-RNase H-integrase [Mycena venus]
MFDRCRSITINGGVFTMFNNSTPHVEEDEEFPCVRLRDLIFTSYIGKDDIVEYRTFKRPRRHDGIHPVRVVGSQEIHHARIFRSQDIMTVVVYRGGKFAELRAKAIELQSYRNAHLPQLFGIVNSPAMTALVYHDGLIPLRSALSKCTSYLSRKIIQWQMTSQFRAFETYWHDLTGSWIRRRGSKQTHFEYYRMSTGQICLDLTPSCDDTPVVDWPQFSLWPSDGLSGVEVLSASGCVSLAELIDTVEIDDVLRVFAEACHMISAIVDPLQFCFRPAAVYGALTPVAMVPIMSFLGASSDLITEHGWFHDLSPRVNNKKLAGIPAHLKITALLSYPNKDTTLRGTFMADAPTDDLYLFLSHPHTEVGDGSLIFRSPLLGYYWSLRSDGSIPLNPEDLEDIGPPEVSLDVVIDGYLWEPEVYEIMRDMLSRKGFNPEDPATATTLGYQDSNMHNEPTIDFYALGECFTLTAMHPNRFLHRG